MRGAFASHHCICYAAIVKGRTACNINSLIAVKRNGTHIGKGLTGSNFNIGSVKRNQTAVGNYVVCNVLSFVASVCFKSCYFKLDGIACLLDTYIIQFAHYCTIGLSNSRG